MATLMIVLAGCSEPTAGDRVATVGSGTKLEGCTDGGTCAGRRPNSKPVPDVVGMSVLAACRELRPNGYRGAVVGEVGDGESGPSRVVAQEPEARHKGHEGQLVRLTVSEPYPAGVLEQNPECLDPHSSGRAANRTDRHDRLPAPAELRCVRRRDVVVVSGFCIIAGQRDWQ